MKSLSFVMQYMGKPRSVGAILPSSKYLAEKMVRDIDFKTAKCIIEYGAGTGVFTDKLLEKRNDSTVIIVMENNDEFYYLLKEKYNKVTNLFIVKDSAENVKKYLEELGIQSVDYVVSGLPFASLPRKVSVNILNRTREILRENGKFITFQYTLFKMGLIGEYFKNISIKREIRNLPPAYVLRCSN